MGLFDQTCQFYTLETLFFQFKPKLILKKTQNFFHIKQSDFAYTKWLMSFTQICMKKGKKQPYEKPYDFVKQKNILVPKFYMSFSKPLQKLCQDF